MSPQCDLYSLLNCLKEASRERLVVSAIGGAHGNPHDDICPGLWDSRGIWSQKMLRGHLSWCSAEVKRYCDHSDSYFKKALTGGLFTVTNMLSPYHHGRKHDGTQADTVMKK